MIKNLKKLTAVLLLAAPISMMAQLPSPTQEAKPGVRWWWLGSAVDKPNLQWNLKQYSNHGIGAVEITPIYGVQGNEANDIDYLSPKWMDMLRYTESEAKKDHIEVDMATGTGWPFGGPWVPINEAACKAVFADTIVPMDKKLLDIEFNIPEKEKPYAKLQVVRAYPVKGDKKRKRVIAVYISRTQQKVKRAAPGGEGWVIDHFDKDAVKHYLAHIDSAFTASGTPFPHTFFNDSYEVYGANWTPTLFEEFERRRGYDLKDKLPELLAGDKQTVSDYRETLSNMLLENFTNQWTAWAHSHGAITRNQAHGSPANLIDCYAAVDIPEIEGFGLTDFGINGLRKDPGFTRPNFSDLSMLKYAPSAAHITGKKYTSSETFTWLTEHFRTSLSQMKPDMDLMFCAGVNHMFFHGTAYSPKDDQWPGWKFYASIDMSPTNSIWRDAPYFMKYITRCQTYLQWGKPDNDFLVYLPVKDMWKENTKDLLMQFDIHSMAKKAPGFIKTILAIDSLGFDCDYISDQYLDKVKGYKGIIIPERTCIDEGMKKALKAFDHVIYGVNAEEMKKYAVPEEMKEKYGMKMIRRTNPYGYHYFIANLTPKDVKGFTHIAALPNKFTRATKKPYMYWYNPMDSTFETVSNKGNQIYLNLKSGESRILIISDKDLNIVTKDSQTVENTLPAIDLTHSKWTLSFIEEAPKVNRSFKMNSLKTWEKLSEETGKTMGTGVYETSFKLNKKQASLSWKINLGDVRESARVYINGHFIGCAWAIPYILDCGKALKNGKNTIRIEVTNLPANRIADLDRQGINWRKMKEINVVNINYKKTSYSNWDLVPSGLNSTVKLINE